MEPMAALPTDTARGLLMLTLGSDMVVSTATVSVWATAATAMAVLATDMARGPLMLRPSLRLMPGWDMVASTATVLVSAMAVLAMDTARGLLMLRPSPGWDMVDSTATVLVWAMAATVMAVLATDTARSKLYQKPRLTISYNTPNDLNRLIQTSLTRDHVELLSYIPKSFKIM